MRRLGTDLLEEGKMSQPILHHAVGTILVLLSLWLLPWALILAIAALASCVERRLAAKAPPPLRHFPAKMPKVG